MIQRITQPRGSAAESEPDRLLHQADVSRRWRISPRTLEAWRHRKAGPPFIRVGRSIRYRLQDVLEYETSRLHRCENMSGVVPNAS